MVWQLQDLATTMLELWNLMDTPIEDQQRFQNVTSNIAASEHEVTEPNTLSEDFINYVSYNFLEKIRTTSLNSLSFRIPEAVVIPCRLRQKYLD